MYRSRMPKPIDTTSMAIRLTPFLRSGFHSPQSLQGPEHTAGNHCQGSGQNERQSQHVVEHEGRQGAEGDDLAVSEVREAGGAEDHGQPDTGQCDDESEDETVRRELQEPVGEGLGGGVGLANGESHRLGC